MPNTAAVEQTLEVRTYAELWDASDTTLRTGLGKRSDVNPPMASRWQFLSSIVLTAFAFEAYLNYVGGGVQKKLEEA